MIAVVSFTEGVFAAAVISLLIAAFLVGASLGGDW